MVSELVKAQDNGDIHDRVTNQFDPGLYSKQATRVKLQTKPRYLPDHIPLRSSIHRWFGLRGERSNMR